MYNLTAQVKTPLGASIGSSEAQEDMKTVPQRLTTGMSCADPEPRRGTQKLPIPMLVCSRSDHRPFRPRFDGCCTHHSLPKGPSSLCPHPSSVNCPPMRHLHRHPLPLCRSAPSKAGPLKDRPKVAFSIPQLLVFPAKRRARNWGAFSLFNCPVVDWGSWDLWTDPKVNTDSYHLGAGVLDNG